MIPSVPAIGSPGLQGMQSPGMHQQQVQMGMQSPGMQRMKSHTLPGSGYSPNAFGGGQQQSPQVQHVQMQQVQVQGSPEMERRESVGSLGGNGSGIESQQVQVQAQEIAA